MEKVSRPDLRIGIISDPHVGFAGHHISNPYYYGHDQAAVGNQDKWWEYSLKYFKSRGVDAIVVPGDMANAFNYQTEYATPSAEIAAAEMARCGKMFRKVFKGTKTQLICIYGNHDNVTQAAEKLNGGSLTPWEDAFCEPYQDYVLKRVNGFTFIGGHWNKEDFCKDLIKKEAEKTPDKPVFYIQHSPITGTTCDSFGVESNDSVKEIVKDYDNVIVLFGHTHWPITDERTIWQSAKKGDLKCTAISCSTMNYSSFSGELIRGDNLWTKHGLILEVSGANIRVERLSFFTPEMLALAKGEKKRQNLKKCVKSCGADWCFTLKGKEMDWDKRSENATAPEFYKGAKSGFERGATLLNVAFPAAAPLNADNDLIDGYYAEAIDEKTGKVVSSNHIHTECHIDHSADFMSRYYQITLSNLKPETDYEVRVYARDCWQKQSLNPIVHHITTLKEDKVKTE